MTEINWQPLTFLPKIGYMINGMLDAAKETYEPLRQIKINDDYTIKRIFEVTGNQVEDEWMYDEQLSRWMEDKDLKPEQRTEIQTLQKRMEELKQVNRKILAIAEEHKDKTIEKVMSKSDAEIGLDFLLGKLKL
ncbi:hypothetical protein MHK_003696 [Candidatus Magnetomorum sp. HK-1]|nr:hypothetical protein MHK_003696 [Candidatus Magnetomorum sp. HK-1]